MSAFELKLKGAFAAIRDPLLIAQAAVEGHGDQDGAVEAASFAIQEAARNGVGEIIAAGLRSIISGFEMLNGPRPVSESGNWDAELDEAVEQWADLTIRQGVGNDGIGEVLNTLQAGTPEVTATWIVTVATAWAPLVIDGLVKELTPAKVLAAAGILKKDLRLPKKGAAGAAPVVPEVPTLSQDIHTVVSALKDFAVMFGLSSSAGIVELLGGDTFVNEQFWSTDQVMRASALTRIGAIGVEPALGRVIASNTITAGELMLAAFETGHVPAAAAAPTGGKPAEAKRGRRRGHAVTEINGVVAMLRKYGGRKDAELAALLGISRPAMVKICDGKTGWDPAGPEELIQLRELVNEVATAMDDANGSLKEFGA